MLERYFVCFRFFRPFGYQDCRSISVLDHLSGRVGIQLLGDWKGVPIRVESPKMKKRLGFTVLLEKINLNKETSNMNYKFNA